MMTNQRTALHEVKIAHRQARRLLLSRSLRPHKEKLKNLVTFAEAP
jgi:hypothetical protein